MAYVVIGEMSLHKQGQAFVRVFAVMRRSLRNFGRGDLLWHGEAYIFWPR